MIVMTKEPSPAGMDAWPEDAQRRVTALEKELEECRAERAHYVGIVEAHEYDWMIEESLTGQVEALGIANAELEIECEHLRARLAEHRNSALRSGRTQPGAAQES